MVAVCSEVIFPSVLTDRKANLVPVRAAFLENFTRRNELGAGCCIYHRGEKVVDLWGGARDRAGEPWEEDTMVLVHSATKGLSAMTLAVARLARLRGTRRDVLAGICSGRQRQDHRATAAGASGWVAHFR